MLGEKGTVLKTSFMYESKPMYLTDQPNFLNCAVLYETKEKPFKLLRFLNKIEKKCGRDNMNKVVNGPRTLDLDIIYYSDKVMASNNLNIPHIGL